MRINTFNLFLFTAFIKSNDGRPLVVALCPTHCSPVNAILPDPRTLDEYTTTPRQDWSAFYIFFVSIIPGLWQPISYLIQSIRQQGIQRSALSIIAWVRAATKSPSLQNHDGIGAWPIGFEVWFAAWT